MSYTKYSIIAAFLVLMLLVVPGLAKQDEEDQYLLKDEWKNKHLVKEDYGQLTHVVFLLTDVTGPLDETPQAYELLDYKWVGFPIQYTINPSLPVKTYRLTQSAVVQSVRNSFESWDTGSGSEMYAAPVVNSKAKASLSNPDGKNVITWGRLTDKGVIAVSSVWYYTSTRQIIDADMVFNTNYKWGIDQDGEGADNSLPARTFDIQDICTHEAGHFCSLGDIYDPEYSAMTMFGYAGYGEVNKISLEPGDIAGLQINYP